MEIKWHQRARAKWVACGDRNTKYFHALASTKKRVKWISSITLAQGEICHTTHITQAFTDFYIKLLGTEFTTPSFSPSNLYSDLSSELLELANPFSENEIKLAVMAMSNNKACGPDGYPNEFFKIHWEVVKKDLMLVFNSLFAGHLDLSSHNLAHIILLPKEENACQLSAFRPISLISYVPKLISKVLARRLAPYIPMLISTTQTGFVSGRMLPENFNSARELISEISKQREPAILLKLDFRKAFDSVSWNFLFQTLQCRGFPPSFVSWIKLLLQTATSKLVINEQMGSSFPHKRGLRQGDPLSPFLFLLAGDVLCKMLHSAATSIDEGITIRLSDPFYLLQYADDTLIFSTTKGNALTSLHGVLQNFSLFSGIAINESKSTLIPFNLTQQVCDSIRASFNCTVSTLPINYLGLPLTKGRPDRAAFQALIDKIHAKLQGWKGALLSRAGRIVLAKAVLSSIPVFYMSVFRLPIWVIKAIDKIRRNFIWGKGTAGTKGIPLLSWDKMCLPKDAGGFGLTNLHLQNLALLLKWWWRIYEAPDSQWAVFAKLLYAKRDSNIPAIGWNGRGSFFWNDLMALRLYFQISTYTEIHSGMHNLFWFDKWGQTRLLLFGSEPTYVHRRSISLANALPIISQLLPAPLTREQTDLISEANHLQFNTGKDRLHWRWTANGIYSAASMYKTLVTAGKIVFSLKRIWKIKVTPSIKCFLLLLAHNKILTQEQLRKRGISFEEKCVLCNQSLCETAPHLFLSCSFSNALWAKLSQTTGIGLVNQETNCSDALAAMLALTAPNAFSETVIATAFWGLWLERNNRTFREECRPLSVIHDWIVGEATLFRKFC